MKRLRLNNRSMFLVAIAFAALAYFPLCQRSPLYGFVLGVIGALVVYAATRDVVIRLIKSAAASTQFAPQPGTLGLSFLGKPFSFLYVIGSPLLLAEHAVLAWLVGFTLGQIIGIFHAIFHRDTVELNESRGALQK